MSDKLKENAGSLTEQLATDGYWPACAARFLYENKFSSAVQVCKEHLADEPDLISGRVLYAAALFRARQTDSAAEQFHHVLALDPNHMVALKHLGDIKMADGDEIAALAHYRRILEIDPTCQGLKCDLEDRPGAMTRTITLIRGAEKEKHRATTTGRNIPFYTETIGDLYMSQGYPRLAVQVYGYLVEKNENPRLTEKLLKAEGKIKDKES